MEALEQPIISAQFDGPSILTVCTHRHVLCFKIPQFVLVTSIIGGPFSHATSFNSMIAAITQNPTSSQYFVLIYQLITGVFFKNIELPSKIIDIQSTSANLFVSLDTSIHIFDANSFQSVSIIARTSSIGLMAISPFMIAYPNDEAPGSVHIAPIPDFTVKTTIQCHKSDIKSMSLSSNSEFLVTASTKGTVIRLFSTLDEVKEIKVGEFRRGFTYGEIITLDADEQFVCAVSKTSIHVFNRVGNHSITPIPTSSAKVLSCKVYGSTLMLIETSGLVSIYDMNQDTAAIEPISQHRLLNSLPGLNSRSSML